MDKHKRNIEEINLPVMDLFAAIDGKVVVYVPNNFSLPACYKELGLVPLLESWGIEFFHITDDSLRLCLPAEWAKRKITVPSMMSGDSDDYQMVRIYDSKGLTRLVCFDSIVLIKPPVCAQIEFDDDEVWVDVLHKEAPVFHSTKFMKDGDISDAVLAPFYAEAELYIREHYPHLYTDPNIYW